MDRESVISMSEHEGGLLLKEWGIPVVEQILARDRIEARNAAREIGFPVALKVCSEKILHKTEQAGVILNLPDIPALDGAASTLAERFPHTPLLVQKMAGSGTELILGAKRDPVFGPVVLAGLGGIFTEIFRDTVTELAPLSRKQARSMLERLKGYPLLCGYRSQPPVDIPAVVDALVSLSKLMARRSDILEIDINPLIAQAKGAVAVDALVRKSVKPALRREAGAHSNGMERFFSPETLAIIGASKSPGKGGNIILRNLLKAGFKGRIFPINKASGEILGMKAYPRVSDVPGPVDLAMIIIPKASVEDAVEDCSAKGVQNIILATGGYSDMGKLGAIEQEDLADKVKASGIRLMGPNSIGTLNPGAGMATSIVGLEQIRSGGVSLIGQSGVFSSGWGRWIADFKPFGIAKVACIGNKADVSESDLLEYLTSDPMTATIGMYLEGVVDGERFVSAASRACRTKPVVVVKSGRTEAGAQAIASHTGSLAGSDAVFDTVCRRTGMVRVHDSEAFFDTLSAFESLPLPRGNRMGVLSVTGMGCVVTTDAAEEYGVEIPKLNSDTVKYLRQVIPAWAPARNPVDVWSAVEQHGSMKTMSHIAQGLISQKDIDALLIIFVLMPETIFDIEEAFGEIVARYPDKPVLASYYGGTRKEIVHIHEGFTKLGVPSYPTPERAIFAFSRMVQYARFRGIIRK